MTAFAVPLVAQNLAPAVIAGVVVVAAVVGSAGSSDGSADLAAGGSSSSPVALSSSQPASSLVGRTGLTALATPVTDAAVVRRVLGGGLVGVDADTLMLAANFKATAAAPLGTLRGQDGCNRWIAPIAAIDEEGRVSIAIKDTTAQSCDSKKTRNYRAYVSSPLALWSTSDGHYLVAPAGSRRGLIMAPGVVPSYDASLNVVTPRRPSDAAGDDGEKELALSPNSPAYGDHEGHDSASAGSAVDPSASSDTGTKPFVNVTETIDRWIPHRVVDAADNARDRMSSDDDGSFDRGSLSSSWSSSYRDTGKTLLKRVSLR